MHAVFAAVLVTYIVGSAVAITTCDKNIVNNLKEIKDCYTKRKPPVLTPSGKLGTHVRISKGAMPPEVKCITAQGKELGADVTLYDRDDKVMKSFSVSQIPVSDVYGKLTFLLESDPAGAVYPEDARYRLYPIHNENNVYSYYRCTDRPLEGNTPDDHVVNVAVGCNHVNDKKSQRVIDKAMRCFEALGIKNVETLPPCNCASPDTEKRNWFIEKILRLFQRFKRLFGQH